MNVTSSAVIFINARSKHLQAVVVHELFHALEFRYSLPAANSWLGEATATWSEHIWAPADDARVASFAAFQEQPPPPVSLNSVKGHHDYGAMVWPLWLEQTRGGPSAVFSLWRRMIGVSDPAQVDKVVDDVVNWRTEFKSFALEDLNLALPVIMPLLFMQQDPLIKAGLHPSFIRGESNLGVRDDAVPVNLGHLQAQYDWIVVDGLVRKVSLNFSGIPTKNTDVLVLLHDRSGWRSTSVDDGRRLELCNDTAAEAVTEIYVIVDNYSFQGSNNQAIGQYLVMGTGTCAS